ncbi:hypothetical protein, partial [Streptomyces radiopugnans]|uniref:hypothetical protein n=1 Tax=Streptomyces radiopugnans TaxID=403935 RepID=UPI003F1B842E
GEAGRVVGVFSIFPIIAYFVWVLQLRPRVKDVGDFLVVRNCYTEISVPWHLIAGAQWGSWGKFYLILDGRKKGVAVEAFSDWPSFGRREKVFDELKRGRMRSRSTESLEIEAKRFLGGAEILILVYVFISFLYVILK